MLGLIIKKEVISALRDVRIQVASIFLFSLMLIAVLVGRQAEQKIQQQRDQAQAEMYDKWVNQGMKHPHSAAHYGLFAFKPKSALSFMDVGLDNYTGVSVFLEAHRQNEVLYSAAQDSYGITRFGDMTAALVWQILFPLLIIFLTFNSFSREREEGTLKLVYGQGASMRQLLMGKILGTYLNVTIIFIPVVILSYVLLTSSSELNPTAASRFLGLTISYFLYFLVFVLLSVLVSAFSKNSSASLLSLLGLWIIACVVLPKATMGLADKIHPAPTQLEFKNTIQQKVREGIDGHNPSDARLATLKTSVLEQYGVETIEELPVNWSGIAMQAGEEYTDQVYDAEFSRVENIFQQQNQLSEWVGFLNPYMAVRHLSMAFAGTDFFHHVTFVKAAENYRRGFVKVMNKDMEVNHTPDIAYSDYNVGKEMWERIEPFQYEMPGIGKIIGLQWRSIITLLLWTFSLFGFAIWNAPKIAKL